MPAMTARLLAVAFQVTRAALVAAWWYAMLDTGVMDEITPSGRTMSAAFS